MPTGVNVNEDAGEQPTGMQYPYKYEMGIVVDGYALPDVSEWNYTVGDLDTSGSRDATGLLHRAYVATKVNYEFKWNAIEWKMLEWILRACSSDKFKLRAPDPRTFTTYYRGDYYVGDRTGSAQYYRTDKREMAVFDLKLKFIEY